MRLLCDGERDVTLKAPESPSFTVQDYYLIEYCTSTKVFINSGGGIMWKSRESTFTFVYFTYNIVAFAQTIEAL